MNFKELLESNKIVEFNQKITSSSIQSFNKLLELKDFKINNGDHWIKCLEWNSIEMIISEITNKNEEIKNQVNELLILIQNEYPAKELFFILMDCLKKHKESEIRITLLQILQKTLLTLPEKFIASFARNAFHTILFFVFTTDSLLKKLEEKIKHEKIEENDNQNENENDSDFESDFESDDDSEEKKNKETEFWLIYLPHLISFIEPFVTEKYLQNQEFKHLILFYLFQLLENPLLSQKIQLIQHHNHNHDHNHDHEHNHNHNHNHEHNHEHNHNHNHEHN
ncbi:zinc transporter slc39a7 [Anaeramoeba ignava]|uniref:Zinc transporter slc39a7 n=1 Tax=Anaeramoeba ignava TaxID=1746090 RepID=A0A9Q0RBD4_ANAIG|nr:zinc transporter slc39a7 [Anaeramoeba ignava]